MPLVPAYIAALQPYEAGRTLESVRRQYGLSRIVKLASNENPLGASPLAIEATEVFRMRGWNNAHQYQSPTPQDWEMLDITKKPESFSTSLIRKHRR